MIKTILRNIKQFFYWENSSKNEALALMDKIEQKVPRILITTKFTIDKNSPQNLTIRG